MGHMILFLWSSGNHSPHFFGRVRKVWQRHSLSSVYDVGDDEVSEMTTLGQVELCWVSILSSFYKSYYPMPTADWLRIGRDSSMEMCIFKKYSRRFRGEGEVGYPDERSEDEHPSLCLLSSTSVCVCVGGLSALLFPFSLGQWGRYILHMFPYLHTMTPCTKTGFMDVNNEYLWVFKIMIL